MVSTGKKREAEVKRGKQKEKERKEMDRTLKDKVVVKPKKADTIKIIMNFSDLYYSLMILAHKNALDLCRTRLHQETCVGQGYL